jgi:hypothetical protein
MAHDPRGVERSTRVQLGGESMLNRTRIAILVAVALLVLSPTAAIAGIHTWDVGEVFSNADGSIQFVEFVEADGGNTEIGISGGSTSSNAGPKNFSWSGAPVTNTANKRYLVGSQSFANLTGAPPVDAIMPLSVLPFFFQPASDTVNFQGWDSCTFTAIPTNGVGSRDCVTNINTTSNSPTNYAGTAASVVASLAPGLIDNFQNGSLQNWSGGTNQASGGPAGGGDRYLEYTTGPGGPLSVSNEFQWAGDAIAAGADSIDVNLNNLGSGSLSIRIMLLTPGCELGGGACTAWTSAGAVLLPPSSGWANVSFSVQEADLIRVLGSDSYAASLANVERVIIRHDFGPPDPPQIVEIVSGTLGVDNVVLPEPSGPLGLVAGVALIGLLQRRGRPITGR